VNRELDDDVLRVASAVADRSPIAWVVEESRRPELKEMFEQLRGLERLARIHEAPGLAPVALDDTVLQHRDEVETPAQWGPLRILARLGEGGFGTVYRAYDPSLQRDVALKLWRPSKVGRESYLREARRLARVRHPNILAVHGADEHDGLAGIWTDLLEGVTLEKALQQRGPFSAEEAALAGLELCRALAAVHAAGLVHRDVKTANVMREQGGRVVLLDFGATSEMIPSSDAGDDSVWGTPITMAPEQLRGETVGPKTDIYGVGVLLYRLVSGRYPYEADSLSGLRALHEKAEPVPLLDRRPGLPPAFVSVVHRAIARDPADRFQSIGALFQALAESVGLGARVSPIEERTTAKPRSGWIRPRLWISGVAAAGLFVTAAIFLMPKPRPSAPTTQPSRHEASGSLGEVTPPVASRGPADDPSEGMLTASTHLYRARGAEREELMPGSGVGIGDELFMEFECPDRAHVYVLNEDANGDVFVLFPIAGLSEQNPLAPGRSHRLPGRKGERLMNWGVSSKGGGGEVVIVIASRTPQPDLERDIAAFRRAAEASRPVYAQLSVQTTTVLRGIGQLVEAPEDHSPRAPARLSSALRTLPKAPGGGRSIWTWQIALRNTTQR